MKELEEEKSNEYLEDVSEMEVASSESVAEILQRTREERGWSVDVVAGRLKLSAWQVKALEDSSSYKDVFKHPSSLRGFIRNYAKLLGLDPAPLLEGVKEFTVHRTIPIEEVAKTMSAPLPKYNGRAWMSDSRSRGFGKKLFALLLVAVLIAVGTLLVVQYDVSAWFAKKPTDDISVQTNTVVPESPAITANGSQTQVVNVPLVVPPVDPNTVAPEQPPVQEAVQTLENSALMASSEATTPKILEITASADAWLEVRTMSGVKLHTFYLRADSAYKVPVNVYPVVLVTNKPKVIAVQWNQEPLILSRVGRGGVTQAVLQ